MRWSDAMDKCLTDAWVAGRTTLRIAELMSATFRTKFTKNGIVGRAGRMVAAGLLVARPSPIKPKAPPAVVKEAGEKLTPKDYERRGAAQDSRHWKQVRRQAIQRNVFDKGMVQPASPSDFQIMISTPFEGYNEQWSIDSVTESHTATFKPRARPSEPCCWLTNDARPWRYCDAPSEPGRPYCPAHQRVAVAPRTLKPIDPESLPT